MKIQLDVVHLHEDDSVPVKKIAQPILPAAITAKTIDRIRPVGCIQLKRFDSRGACEKHIAAK